MSALGIENLAVYPSTLSLDMGELCRARGRDLAYVRDTLGVEARSVPPPWEDTVTLAVNAADLVVSEDDRARIGLVVVGTETSVDQEKPVSAWVHRHLGLPSRCRSFEIKHACYGATAGLRVALSWLGSGEARGQAALVIAADYSLTALGEPYEPVLGLGTAAFLVSDRPDFLVVDPGPSGIFSQEGEDVIRPTPIVEAGNASASVFAYLDALDGAWADYQAQVGPVDYEAAFDAHIYHSPLWGMACRAHRSLLGNIGACSRDQIDRSFDARVAPGLRHIRRMGETYSASTFIALLTQAEVQPPGARLSVFAYGAGCCSELYAARLGPEARAVAARAALGARLDARVPLDVPTYEAIEAARNTAFGKADFRPDRALCPGHFEAAWAGSGRLVLDEVRGHHRRYARS